MESGLPACLLGPREDPNEEGGLSIPLWTVGSGTRILGVVRRCIMM